jgi:hypothetical protein
LMPISICAVNNRLFADVQLWNAPPLPKAEIIHDHFAIQPPDWDWNFDDEAFEAVDGHLRPMLQLIYRSPSEIDVRALFIAHGRGMLATDKGSVDFGLQKLNEIVATNPSLEFSNIPMKNTFTCGSDVLCKLKPVPSAAGALPPQARPRLQTWFITPSAIAGMRGVSHAAALV